MSAGRPAADDADEIEGFAVAVAREDNSWQVTALDRGVLEDLALAEQSIRDLRASGAAFGLIDVDDEFFVIVRPGPAGTRLLISDATAALDYDLASDVLEALHLDVPDEDEVDEPYAEGDFGILLDLGLDEATLTVIVDDTDLYADEQLGMIAARLGFSSQLGKVVD